MTIPNAELFIFSQSYNKLLTYHEEQLQFILQVVSLHRSANPDARIITLTQHNEQRKLEHRVRLN